MPKLSRAEIRNILGDTCTDEIENRIIAAHLAVVDPLKDDLAKYKADAEKLPIVQQELDNLKSSGNDWETKYNEEHNAFEKYKSDVAASANEAKISTEYRKVLKDMGIDEKRHDAILRLTDFSKMKLGDNGGLQDIDTIKKQIQSDWSDFIPDTHEEGQDVGDPPSGKVPSFDKMSLRDKMVYANQHPNAPEVVAWLKK